MFQAGGGCLRREFRLGWGGREALAGQIKTLAAMLNFASSENFAEQYGPKWAYLLRPAVERMRLPYYSSFAMARADGWGDLKNTVDGSPWPWPDLTTPKEALRTGYMEAFIAAKELMMRRQHRKGGDRTWRQSPVEDVGDCEGKEKPRSRSWRGLESRFMSWIARTVGDD